MDTKSTRTLTRDSNTYGNSDYISKMPTATMEQLNIAKLLSKPDDEKNLRSYVAQLQEMTECTEDQAVTALYDCENNLERAIDLLLDNFRSETESEWHTTTGKRVKLKSQSNSTDKSHETNEKGQSSDSTGRRPRGVGKNNHSPRGTYDGAGYDPSSPVTNLSQDRSNSQLSSDKDVRSRKLNGNDGEAVVDERAAIARTNHGLKRSNSPKVREMKPKSQNPLAYNTWDPYTEYGNWGGDAIEIVNSNAAIATGLQGDSSIPAELLVDVEPKSDRTRDPLSPEESSAASQTGSISLTLSSNGDNLFIKKPLSKPPPPCFANLPDVPVFIVPGILPSTSLKWSVKFGGELSIPSTTPSCPLGSAPNDAVSPVPAAELSQTPGSIKSSPIPISQEVNSFVPLSIQSKPGTKLEGNKSSSGLGTLDAPCSSSEDKDEVNTTFTNAQYKNVAPAHKASSYPVPQNRSSGFNSENNTGQGDFLEPQFKTYLDGLSSDLNSLSVGDSVAQGPKTSQYGLPQASQPQPSVVSLSQPQSGSISSLQHVSTHISTNPPQSTVSTTAPHAHQQTALPTGMTHFIGQFPAAAAAYHMFNLAGGSTNGPTVLDLDHLQYLQHQQQRILYDAHMQHQAATTVQSLLTSSSDATSTSKSSAHGLPGSLNHITASNATMRPELMAPAVGHAPQMMTPGTPYPYYPGFLFMNGYPNTFLSQQQQQQHANQESVQTAQGPTVAAAHCSSPQSQPGSQPQSYSELKSVNTGAVNPYDDLMELKYGDPVKQMGFKNNSNQPAYGHFPAQAVSTDNVISKLPTNAHSPNNPLSQGYNANAGVSGGPHHQQFSPHFYPSAAAPYFQAAVVAAAAAAASAQQQQQQQVANGPASNQTSGAQGGGPSTGGQLHLPGGSAAQAMVLGTNGAGGIHHHHQRTVLSHQH